MPDHRAAPERQVAIDDDVLELFRQAFDWARHGDTTALGGFLERGGPVDLTNTNGDTLLILAAYHRQGAVVHLLLAHAARVDRINDNGQTALAAAVFRGSTSTVRLLLAAGADPHHGPRSAHEIARFFNLTEMQDILRSEAVHS